MRAFKKHVHLSDGARNLSPDAVNLIVEPLERESLQGWVRLRQEAHQTRSRCESRHYGV